MLDIVLMVISMAAGGGDGQGTGSATAAADQATAPGASTLVAEPQVPTGKFTTATEVKPILTATRGNWVAVRDWNGEDLLYITHLLSWRCGLLAVRVGINGAAPEDWPLPPCYADTASPNAIKTEDGLPYRGYPQGSIDSVTVELVYDDLTEDSARFERSDVLMP